MHNRSSLKLTVKVPAIGTPLLTINRHGTPKNAEYFLKKAL